MLSARLPREQKRSNPLQSLTLFGAQIQTRTAPSSLPFSAPFTRFPSLRKIGITYSLTPLMNPSTRPNSPTIFDVLRTRLDRLPPWLGLIATTRNEPRVSIHYVISVFTLSARRIQKTRMMCAALFNPAFGRHPSIRRQRPIARSWRGSKMIFFAPARVISSSCEPRSMRSSVDN